MRRGEVWWADLPPPTGRRPVVLLSRDDAYAVRALVTVAPVTTRIRSIPAEVPLGAYSMDVCHSIHGKVSTQST
ncbi:MAG: type II toxin-antitoxin system PemK/MazF family toxin [Planctomycetaceae bacterium]|nr:MAG: type II toxin-antitoxin system PemK/MazF family toxin [Planctomycetaceae bacterium]